MSFNIPTNNICFSDNRQSNTNKIKIKDDKDSKPLIYNIDSYSSPSQITVNNTKDFDKFLIKISKSHLGKKVSSSEKIKKEKIFNDNTSLSKVLFKSSRTLKISLLDSQMNIIFKDSLLKNESVNNFAFASEMKIPFPNENGSNSNNSNKSQSNNYRQNPNLLIEPSSSDKDILITENLKTDSSFIFNNNVNNLSIKNQKSKNADAFAHKRSYLISSSSSIRKTTNNAFRYTINTINTNDSINIQANKLAILSNGGNCDVAVAEENRIIRRSNIIDFHSAALNKNRNERYLGIDHTYGNPPETIESDDYFAVKNFFQIPNEIHNNKKNNNLKFNIETPESNASINTVDRGLAFLNSRSNFPNINNSLKKDINDLNKYFFETQSNRENYKEDCKAQENNTAEKKNRYKATEEHSHAIKQENCSLFYNNNNINSSEDFLKSLKLNNCFRNFLFCSHMAIENNNFFSIFAAEKRDERFSEEKKQVDSIIDFNSSNKRNFVNINTEKTCENIKKASEEQIPKTISNSFYKKGCGKFKIKIEISKKSLIELMLITLLFIYVYSAHLISKSFKSKIKCMPLEMKKKAEHNSNERKLKKNYKSSLQEFNGFIID